MTHVDVQRLSGASDLRDPGHATQRAAVYSNFSTTGVPASATLNSVERRAAQETVEVDAQEKLGVVGGSEQAVALVTERGAAW